MSGQLYGIGMGPGDPGLVTLRAAELLRGLPVVACVAAEGTESRALRLARPHLGAAAEVIEVALPMRRDRAPAQAAYDDAAAAIAARLEAGADVGVLCEGDPLFYGSFMYLAARLPARVAEVVPGVTSVSAAAAMARLPLVARNEALTVLPGPLDDAALAARLAEGGAVAVMKVGRHVARLRALLAREGRAARAVYVAEAGRPDQVVLPLAEAPDPAPYFSMILIPGDDAHAHA